MGIHVCYEEGKKKKVNKIKRKNQSRGRNIYM